MGPTRVVPPVEERSEEIAALAAGGDPVGILLALGLAFRAIEDALGEPQPWMRLDVTMGQLKAVMLIVQTGGVTSSTLAENLGIARSAATALVDRLVEQKLARRETDPADRRVVRIRPTARAMALHQSLLQTRRPVLERVWREVPPDQRESVNRALELLLDCAEQALQNSQRKDKEQE